MSIKISPDVLKIRRKTDSLLDWLGDWGGLLDSLHFLVDILINPFAAYMMKSKLALLLVKLVPSKTEKGLSKYEDLNYKHTERLNDPHRRKIV